MFIADLHIHSQYSRATSRECVPEFLELWARRKGIGLLGTGDFTHPAWREELREKLIPAEEGLYLLKDDNRLPDEGKASSLRPRFVVSGEISSIYKKNGKVRKVHNLILLPSIEAGEALAKRLETIGNLHSDGRPILGLDSRDLLEITLEVCPEAVFIPAHIWTPHFSLFGAFSGFDRIEECFEDMTPQIHALETGLSSDPPMNWRLSALDPYLLVSNSDAHSPAKLGREANLFDTELSYPALAGALTGRSDGLQGTIEFFPEEGKYHYDGHRNCGACLSPAESAASSNLCPVCGKRVTIGVLHRVEQLADRPEGCRPAKARAFESLIPLPEVIAASTGFSASGKKTAALYETLLRELGSEFEILRSLPPADIGLLAGPCVAEGIRRMRSGKVSLSPGYDGEYGKIHLLKKEEIEFYSGQLCFSGCEMPEKESAPAGLPLPSAPLPDKIAPLRPAPLPQLNEEQLQAVTSEARVLSVTAGPGTGKTKTLIARIEHLVKERGVRPSEITAVTFTNKAAGELKQRLAASLSGKRSADSFHVGTFHSLCLKILSRKGPVTVIGEEQAACAAQEMLREAGEKGAPQKFLRAVSAWKNGMPETAWSGYSSELFQQYARRLENYGVLDWDDLLLRTLELFENGSEKCFPYLLVDEFQDINELQYRLVKVWSRGGKNLFVIGDPDQSIYGFRGSDPACFQRLGEDFPETESIRLIKNYRSTPEILNSSLSFLSRDGVPRVLEPQKESGVPVRLVQCGDDFSEAIFLAKEINRMVGGVDMLDAQSTASRPEDGKALSFSDIAVLYRTNRQADILEKCLAQEGIPYLVTGRDKFLEDEKVLGTLCFFRSLLDPGDVFSREIALKNIADCGPDSPPTSQWNELVDRYSARIRKDHPGKLLDSWMGDTGLLSPAMEKLRDAASLHDDLGSFLQELTLGEEGDLKRPGKKRRSGEAVFLSTLHGAKGLEFPVVFLCGLKKGLLPLELPGRSADLSEERRLFYVGMTRAREELLLLSPREPSPFLSDLPGKELRRESSGNFTQDGGNRQLSFY